MTNTAYDIAGEHYAASRAQGRKAISSDFTAVINGQEALWILTKQIPWAFQGSAGEIEVPMPLGLAGWERQQNKVNKQGTITFFETVDHKIEQGLRAILANGSDQGGWFDLKVFHGVPNKHIGGKEYKDCFFVPDDADTDWENRSQILTVTGQLFFHYFGKEIPANSATL